MNCPNCGGSVDPSDPFCPHCGHNLGGHRSRRKLRFILMDVQEDRRFRHLASAAVIAVVIVAVLSVLLMTDESTESVPAPIPEEDGPSDDAIIISDTAYIELYDGLSDGTMFVSMGENGALRIELSSSLTTGFDDFTWILKDDTDGTYQYVTKGTADMTWMTPEVGSYTVTVRCASTLNDDESVYTGRMTYFGDIHVQYSFSYMDRDFTVYADVTLGEYQDACRKERPDGDGSVADAVSLVSGSTSINLLAERLRDAYLRAFPYEQAAGASYAGFVLTFIQSCFDVTTDMAVHHTRNYWALPTETLYIGSGDDEDLSVLTASILKVSGYSVGLMMIHGHTVATVVLERYTGPSEVPDGYRVLRVADSGQYHYVMETTEDVPPGCISDAYNISGGRYYYYGVQVRDRCGFSAA